MADEGKLKPLNDKQEVFVSEYLICFNATDAYSRAYPKAKRASARANASELLTKANIKAEINRRLEAVHMGADEALKRMADIARGDITEFITPIGAFDIESVKASGKGHIIKKIKQRTITKIGKNSGDEDVEIHDTEVELYNAKDALDTILKVGGKLKLPEININVSLTDD